MGDSYCGHQRFLNADRSAVGSMQVEQINGMSACWRASVGEKEKQNLSDTCLFLQEHRLQTAEQAEALYRKREKKAAPAGWEAFNNKTLFKAYERRAQDLPVDMEVGCAIFMYIILHAVLGIVSKTTSTHVSACK